MTDAAERSRQRAPEFAEIVATCERHTKEKCRVKWIRFADGTEIGKRGPEGAIAHPPPNLRRV